MKIFIDKRNLMIHQINSKSPYIKKDQIKIQGNQLKIQNIATLIKYLNIEKILRFISNIAIIGLENKKGWIKYQNKVKIIQRRYKKITLKKKLRELPIKQKIVLKYKKKINNINFNKILKEFH